MANYVLGSQASSGIKKIYACIVERLHLLSSPSPHTPSIRIRIQILFMSGGKRKKKHTILIWTPSLSKHLKWKKMGPCCENKGNVMKIKLWNLSRFSWKFAQIRRYNWEKKNIIHRNLLKLKSPKLNGK